MQAPTISATDLARNTREVLDKVASQGATVGIERNRTLIAHIVPATRTMTASQLLAGLKLPVMTRTQAQSWLKDSKAGFGNAMRDPWG